MERCGRVLFSMLAFFLFWGVIEIWKALFGATATGETVGLAILAILSIPFSFALGFVWLMVLVG